jgi:hypothetical protein
MRRRQSEDTRGELSTQALTGLKQAPYSRPMASRSRRRGAADRTHFKAASRLVLAF